MVVVALSLRILRVVPSYFNGLLVARQPNAKASGQPLGLATPISFVLCLSERQTVSRARWRQQGQLSSFGKNKASKTISRSPFDRLTLPRRSQTQTKSFKRRLPLPSRRQKVLSLHRACTGSERLPDRKFFFFFKFFLGRRRERGLLLLFIGQLTIVVDLLVCVASSQMLWWYLYRKLSQSSFQLSSTKA